MIGILINSLEVRKFILLGIVWRNTGYEKNISKKLSKTRDNVVKILKKFDSMVYIIP